MLPRKLLTGAVLISTLAFAMATSCWPMSDCHVAGKDVGHAKKDHSHEEDPQSREKRTVIKACPTNMHYKECGTACPEKCGDPAVKPCVRMCKAGCFCNSGYVLDSRDKCIKKKDCPKVPKCPANMHHSTCASLCPEQCGKKPRKCPKVCRAGCVCDDGYILDKLSNMRCILREQCGPIAPPLVDRCAIVRCAAGYECVDGKCVFRRDCPMIKMAEPPKGCEYKRELDERGCLIPKLHCTPKKEEDHSTEDHSCGPHSHKSSCTSLCPVHCENYNKKLLCRSLRCGSPGCVCDKGYVYKSAADKSQGCVKPAECKPIKPAPVSKTCGRNEQYTNCGSACEPKCGENGPKICTMQCILDVCQCKPGFVRHPRKGCVRPTEC